MASWLTGLDEIKARLEERYPGWQVWYIPHLDKTVTWCARRWPLLNEGSPGHLAEAIEAAGKEEP